MRPTVSRVRLTPRDVKVVPNSVRSLSVTARPPSVGDVGADMLRE